MSIQWTFIAGYLYLEVVIITIMILPIASPRKWNQFFKSRLFAVFREKSVFYFYVLLGVLSLFLFDAIREMRKYSTSSDGGHVHLSSEMKNTVKLFRAQRNFYITGFAIFLAFVIRRLVGMLIIQGELLNKSENIIKEAESLKDMAKSTVLAHSLRSAGDAQDVADISSKLEITENMLKDEVKKNRTLEEEVAFWKTKYEQITSSSNEIDD